MTINHVKFMEFPTDIVEERWAGVRIYEENNETFSELVYPTQKMVSRETAIRLEHIALGLYWQERREMRK